MFAEASAIFQSSRPVAYLVAEARRENIHPWLLTNHSPAKAAFRRREDSQSSPRDRVVAKLSEGDLDLHRECAAEYATRRGDGHVEVMSACAVGEVIDAVRSNGNSWGLD